MIKIVEINFDDIEFKTELTALDYINSRPKKEKEMIIEEVRLIAVSIIRPRLTYEEILGLELSQFNELLQKYMNKIGKILHEKINKKETIQANKPSGSMINGFNFLPISNMNPNKEE